MKPGSGSHDRLGFILITIWCLVRHLWWWRRWRRRLLWCFGGDFVGDSLEIRGISKLDDLVDQTIFLCLFCRHEVVAHQVFPNGVFSLSRHPGVHPHDVLVDLQDLLGFYLDVFSLTLCSTHGLMDHGPAVWQRNSLALFPCSQEEGCHRGCQTNIDGDHRRFDVLHSVIDGETRDHRSTRTVYVQVNGLVAVLGIQIKQNSDDLVCQLVINLLANENDSFPIKPVVNVNPFGIRRPWNSICYLGHTQGHHVPAI
mmetsp:Transcript_84924/g.104135  ORF Transcript_84924/g.104135 Transcript_84924/m.104135 type:complete len:255 (+) Transcript_84924:66-830(+)